MQEVRRQGLEERDYKEQLLYLKISKYVQERQQLILSLPFVVADFAASLHNVQVLDNFVVREPSFTWRDQVNRYAQKEKSHLYSQRYGSQRTQTAAQSAYHVPHSALAG